MLGRYSMGNPLVPPTTFPDANRHVILTPTLNLRRFGCAMWTEEMTEWVFRKTLKNLQSAEQNYSNRSGDKPVNRSIDAQQSARSLSGLMLLISFIYKSQKPTFHSVQGVIENLIECVFCERESPFVARCGASFQLIVCWCLLAGFRVSVCVYSTGRRRSVNGWSLFKQFLVATFFLVKFPSLLSFQFPPQ